MHTIERFEPGKQQLTYFKGDEQYYLSLREILFFETEADHVYAHTADQSYEVRMRLYELETTLPGYFVRASRSAIISIMHVFSVQKGLTGLSLLSFRGSHKEIYCSTAGRSMATDSGIGGFEHRALDHFSEETSFSPT